MIFRQVDEILDGRKTQTRRVCNPGEILDTLYIRFHGTVPAVWANDRLKWVVGRTYAVVPKRGQPGLRTHRIRITAIRQERVQDISEADAIAEGCPGCYLHDEHGPSEKTYVGQYARLWQSINTRKGVRWEDNPMVWVITFECVEVEPPA